MTSTITVLGASGLVGRAIVSHLPAATTRPLVLVGRNSERLQAVAASAQDAGALQPAILVTGNKGWATVLNQAPHTELVLNLVGPATRTAPEILDWCLSHRVHYCDVANELDAIRTTLAHDRDARGAEVSVTTGAGFGVVATEALALALRGDRPPPRSARVAAMPGMAGRGRNVAASAVEVLAVGGWAYRGGRLTAARPGSAHWRIPTPTGRVLSGIGVAVGDLEAAAHASGARDVDAFTTEMPANPFVRAVLPLLSRGARYGVIRRVLEYGVSLTNSPGPGAGQAADYVSLSYAELDWPDGTTRRGWLTMGDGYDFTGRVAAAVIRAQLTGRVPHGAYTPAAVLGPKLAYEAGAELVTNEVAVG
jgi:short subunit dehydrogenase-like uncharacterized protein